MMIQERKKVIEKIKANQDIVQIQKERNLRSGYGEINYLPTDIREMLRLLVSRMNHTGLQRKLLMI